MKTETFYFTFGCGWAFHSLYVEIVVPILPDEIKEGRDPETFARSRMNEMFGKFSMCYAADRFRDQLRRGNLWRLAKIVFDEEIMPTVDSYDERMLGSLINLTVDCEKLRAGDGVSYVTQDENIDTARALINRLVPPTVPS